MQRKAVQGRPSRFSLSKWYLDAVSDAGEVFIGYRATVRWGRLGFPYASTLAAGAGEARTRATVKSEEEPILREGVLAWASSPLGVKGRWHALAAAKVARTLYESPEGSVSWRCVLPAARCELVRGGQSFSGLGYVEHLSSTLPPWKLPIDTLRWGRFLTEAHSVVWIDWRKETEGGPPRSWIFFDGREVRGEVSEESVFFEGGRVSLPASGRLVLRSGRLSYLLRNLPISLRTSPLARALAMHETKWRTRGCIELPGKPRAAGWAIHEIVRFGT